MPRAAHQHRSQSLGSCAPVQTQAAFPLRLEFGALLAENLPGKIRSPPETPPHLLQPLLPQRVIFTSPSALQGLPVVPALRPPGTQRIGWESSQPQRTAQLLDQLPAAAAARVSMANSTPAQKPNRPLVSGGVQPERGQGMVPAHGQRAGTGRGLPAPPDPWHTGAQLWALGVALGDLPRRLPVPTGL